MTRRAWPVGVAVLFIVLGCSKPSPVIPAQPGRVDAPYELESDDDLSEVRALFDSLPRQAANRNHKRQVLAVEYARRIDRNLDRGKAGTAFENFTHLIGLWSAPELSQPNGPHPMAAFRPQADRLRVRFSRSGGDIEVVTILGALQVMAPDQASGFLGEITDIFQYSDELAIANSGAGAQRARPILILEAAARSLPSKSLVDLLVSLYRERQIALNSHFRRNGADFELFRVHGKGVLRSARNIVGALVRGERIAQAPQAIADMTGVGDDAELRKRLTAALSSSGPTVWIVLAAAFRADEEDLDAALLLCKEAIKRYPKEATGYLAAAETARAMGNVPMAIRFYEAGIALDKDNQEASETLALLYEARVSNFAYSDRPNAAAKELARFESFHKQATAVVGRPLQPDLANAYAAMARGLVSLGDLKAAESYLERSLALRPTRDALEYLGTIALRRDRFTDARRHLRQAIELDASGASERFEQIKLRRLAAEVELHAGKTKQAHKQLRSTLAHWLALQAEFDMSPPYLAEALVEMGKLRFLLGEPDAGIRLFFRALDLASSASTHADIVAFLVIQNSYDAALDVFLDGLGTETVDSYFKVYMSLWIVAEAKRRGLDPDPHALSFLESRDGGLWHDHLARFSVGKTDKKSLQSMATTRGRRAEFLYYSAVVGPDASLPGHAKLLLQEVVRGSMVLFFEYEMAKLRLSDL